MKNLRKITNYQISATLAVIFFTIYIAYKVGYSLEIILSDAIILGLTAGMLPVAFFLIMFPFKQEINIDELKRFGLQITIGGLVLLYIYGKTIVEIFSG